MQASLHAGRRGCPHSAPRGKGLITNYMRKMRRLSIPLETYAFSNQGWQTIYDYFVNVSPVTSTISW